MDLPASGGTAAMIIYIWIYLPHGDTLENHAFISELQCIMDINVDLPTLGGPSDDIEISSFFI